jgi:hypothetical protein
MKYLQEILYDSYTRYLFQELHQTIQLRRILMFNNRNWFKDPFLSMLMSLLLLSLNACTESYTPQPTSVNVPADTEIVVFVDKQHRSTAVTEKGEPLARCELCTPDLETTYGPECLQAPKDTMCKIGTLLAHTSLTVLKGRNSPYCTTVCDINGCRQRCY